MPGSLIYVMEDGAHDHSRWLQIRLRPNRACLLQVSDLCHPGCLSEVAQVPCDLTSLRSAVERGALQVTLPNGYLLLNRDNDLINIEFKGGKDAQPTRVVLLAKDVQDRLAALEHEAEQAMASRQ